MDDQSTGHGSKRIVAAVIAFVVVIVAFGVAYALLGGADLVADLFGGGTQKQAIEKPKSVSESSGTTGAVSGLNGNGQVSESVEPSEAVASEEASPSSGSTSGQTSNSVSGGSTSPAVSPPTADQAARMYWEQVASQEQIGNLVRGKVKSIRFGTVTVSGEAATVPLTVTYTDGSTLSGRMVLRKYGTAWYFSSIARSGNPLTVTTGKSADLAVVSTIVNQQASNQDLISGIVNGTYTSCAVNGVSSGSGTATVRITLSGGSAAPVAGRITCISKVIDGTKMWFVTSFAKN
ncbi:hypothetical protein MX659_05390 [Coriobacteriia bacterium Es71-Z0120]|uniref:hypothetical protein n=1 Tax=Parvivirga hydrogeniphila TaxID=2939460 RepID=UPI002260CD5B|nr:hypothetical protein [Parvivirga hydrogeniphila]MCL4079020.1 hypothetical protein [Parvivirga hydrogeniphila]